MYVVVNISIELLNVHKSGGKPKGKHGNASRLNITDYLYVFAWSRTFVYMFTLLVYMFTFICPMLPLFCNAFRNSFLSHPHTSGLKVCNMAQTMTYVVGA